MIGFEVSGIPVVCSSFCASEIVEAIGSFTNGSGVTTGLISPIET
jgi:hypothetical protein